MNNIYITINILFIKKLVKSCNCYTDLGQHKAPED